MIAESMIMKLGGTPYYTPEFQRGGLAGTFCLDVIELSGGPTITCTIQHREVDETTWADAGAFDAITVIADHQKDIAGGLKQIIRLKFEFAGGDDSTDTMRFVVQPPSFRPYA